MGLQRYGLVLAWVLIIALALVAPVSADIHTIDSPGAVATTIIEDTIYSAGVTNGDVIVLNPGTYYEHDITVPKDITIRANTSYGGTAANTIIDAQSSGRIFMMDYYRSFAIDNLTLQNGLPTDTEPYGGGIFSRSGNLVVTSSSFINCRSPMNGIYGGGGGAIFSSAGSNSLTVTSSSFTGCSAAQYGGAIESELGVTSIDKSSFSGCSVDTGGYGGAVGSWQDTMTITSSSFYRVHGDVWRHARYRNQCPCHHALQPDLRDRIPGILRPARHSLHGRCSEQLVGHKQRPRSGLHLRDPDDKPVP